MKDIFNITTTNKHTLIDALYIIARHLVENPVDFHVEIPNFMEFSGDVRNCVPKKLAKHISQNIVTHPDPKWKSLQLITDVDTFMQGTIPRILILSTVEDCIKFVQTIQTKKIVVLDPIKVYCLLVTQYEQVRFMINRYGNGSFIPICCGGSEVDLDDWFPVIYDNLQDIVYEEDALNHFENYFPKLESFELNLLPYIEGVYKQGNYLNEYNTLNRLRWIRNQYK